MIFADRLDRESRALSGLVNAAGRGLITFALYDNPAAAELVAGHFRRKLRMPLSFIELSASKQRLAEAVALLGNQPRCIFVIHAEAAFPDLLGHLTRNAERFRHSPHRLVMWITEAGFEQILNGAPAFASLRSQLFDFRAKEVSWHPEPAAVNTQVCGSINEMKERAEAFRETISATDDPAKLADLYNRLGFALAFMRAYGEARKVIRRSLKLARMISDRALEADDLFLLGQVALYLNQLRRAEILLRASARMTTGECDAGMNWALSSLASRQGNLELATGHALASAAKCRVSGDMEGLALALRQLAQCHQAENRFDDAEDTLREVIALPQDQVGPRDRALAEWNLAELTARRGQLDEAESQMWSALRQFQDLQDYESVALAWYRLAGVAEGRRNWAVAVERLEEAHSLWREAGREDYAGRIQARIESLRQFGNWDGAAAALTA